MTQRTVATSAVDVPALLAALVTVVLWGSAFVAIRDAGATLSPGAIALGRLLISVVLLTAAVGARRVSLPAHGDIARLALFGMLWLGVYSVALNAAERRVDAGTAAMVINIGPILIALLAGLFLGEGFPRAVFAGCAVAFAGVSLMGPAGSDTPVSTSGLALLVLAATAYATAVVLQKSVLSRVSPLVATWLGCVAATLACLPFAPEMISELGHDRAAGAWVVYLGVGPTAVGFATYAFALRRMTAGRLAALSYLIPVVAILMGWALLGETPPQRALAGGALCAGGVYITRRR